MAMRINHVKREIKFAQGDYETIRKRSKRRREPIPILCASLSLVVIA
jgi:hypothetical protein